MCTSVSAPDHFSIALHRPSKQRTSTGAIDSLSAPRRPEIAPTQKPCLVLVASVRAPIARLHVAVATTVDVHPQVTLAIFAGRSPPNPFSRSAHCSRNGWVAVPPLRWRYRHLHGRRSAARGRADDAHAISGTGSLSTERRNRSRTQLCRDNYEQSVSMSFKAWAGGNSYVMWLQPCDSSTIRSQL